MRPGYGLRHHPQTADGQAVGERFRPQVGSIGLEARPVSATLVTMTKPSTPAAGPVTTAETDRWCGSVDPPAFARWLADRAVGAGPHLAPVVAVGRCPAGHLAARVLRPAALPLDRAFEELGVPTSGVAVTVSVPLLELAATARAGALELGALGPDDVGLDDAGAVLVVDRPPGAARCCGDESDAEPLHGRRSDPDGARQLVLAPGRSGTVSTRRTRLVASSTPCWTGSSTPRVQRSGPSSSRSSAQRHPARCAGREGPRPCRPRVRRPADGTCRRTARPRAPGGAHGARTGRPGRSRSADRTAPRARRGRRRERPRRRRGHPRLTAPFPRRGPRVGGGSVNRNGPGPTRGPGPSGLVVGTADRALPTRRRQ